MYIVITSMIETLTNTIHRTNQQHPGDENEIIIMPSLAAPSHVPLQTQQGDSPQEQSGTPGKHHTTLKKNTVFSLVCLPSVVVHDDTNNN